MSKTVYFLDIDDTLIKTTSITQDHRNALKSALQSLKIERANEIVSDFSATYSNLYATHQGKMLSNKDPKDLENFVKSLTELEKFIIEKYGEIKIWSREAALYISAEKYGITLSNHNLSDLSNTLWNKITQNASFYPDSLPFLDYLNTQKAPFYLISASDCRLTLDEKTGYFEYDPLYSRNLKLKRFEILYQKGIDKKQVYVGDPYDKPNPWVFLEALNQAKSDVKEKFTSIMIGDSIKNDLLPAKKAGMDKIIWLNRGSAKEKEVRKDRIMAINKLTVDLSIPLFSKQRIQIAQSCKD